MKIRNNRNAILLKMQPAGLGQIYDCLGQEDCTDARRGGERRDADVVCLLMDTFWKCSESSAQDSIVMQPVESETGVGSGARCLRALLREPLAPGASTKLQCTASFTRVQTPVPEAVFQNEPQRMVYEDNAYVLFPYRVLKQTTRVGALGKHPLSREPCHTSLTWKKALLQ